MKLISIRQAPTEFKIALVEAMGFKVEDGRVVLPSGENYFDPYCDTPVRIDSMIVVPGSTLILDDNPLSIAEYDEDHPNVQ